MDIKVVIKRRKPGALSEFEERRRRLGLDLPPEERYIEELFDSRECDCVDPFISGGPQVAQWYATQLGMIMWIDGQPPNGKEQIQHLVGRQQLHGFFQLYSLEQMEFRLQQIMKTIKADRLFICQANRPSYAGIMYMRGYGVQATVKEVSWALNRSSKLIPQVIIQPIRINGRVINRVTGHNAYFIINNGIGPGAQVRVCQTGATKPIIDAVLAKEEPSMPELGTWTLVGPHAEPITAESTIIVLGRQLKKAGIKGVTAVHVKKMVKAGITTISDISHIIDSDDLAMILGPKIGAKMQSGFTHNK